MDKNAIKKYAVWARKELIARVTQKAEQYEITENKTTPADADSIGGRVLTAAEKKQRQALIVKINQDGFEQVMEEVAYTWFNRFTALRFMEVNNYLPSHTRVFTNENGEFKPQILADAIQLDLEGLDMGKVFELKDTNKTEELYKYLLIIQCNALSSILPRMFQKIEDYTELLLPDYLLREGSVIEQMIALIPEEDWTDQVQIIGWLYQYYNIEPKAAVFARPSSKKIEKKDIPAATQLFTPDWIVRYMVENSLGRIWLEGHPNESLKSEWKYYLDEAVQEINIQKRLDDIHKEYAELKPEDIRCIDPCMGSGHILCYMFDVLMKIYEDYGYSAREAVVNIVKKNLWGLDIDERAAQLSYFAVMMKARQYDRRFLTCHIQPHVYAIEESNGITIASMHDMGIDLSQQEYSEALKQTMRLIEEMNDAKEFGSIVHVTPCDWKLLRRFAVPRGVSEGQLRLDIHGEIAVSERLQTLINIGEALSQKFHAVVTNPPYMGSDGMDGKLSSFVKKNYSVYKADMFAVFMKRCSEMTKKTGFQAMITQHTWMFLSSFDRLRKELVQNSTIINMAHLGPRAFEEISGEVVQTVAWVMRKGRLNYRGTYARLVEPTTQDAKEALFLSKETISYSFQESFERIPNMPIAYWISDGFRKLFEDGESITNYVFSRDGLTTGKNELFIKYFWEVGFDRIHFGSKNAEEFWRTGKRFAPLIKGGLYRKWYGNNWFVITYDKKGYEKLSQSGNRLPSREVYFYPYMTWNRISTRMAFRYCEQGYLFESASLIAFSKSYEDMMYALAFANSVVAQNEMQLINPTTNMLSGYVDSLSLPNVTKESKERCIQLAKRCVELAKEDWDESETSWDFSLHPLVSAGRIEDLYKQWEKKCDKRFEEMKTNEQEINSIFASANNLNNEFNCLVSDSNISVKKADRTRDIKSLISYAVGCMFGRYSIYKEGLIYASGKWNYNDYENMAWIAEGKPETLSFYSKTHFFPDQDNIIPICDDEYFIDDIVHKFIEFVSIVYGTENLHENIKFIADALGGKGQPKDVIRNYFLNDFYKDHCKIYQKRPIYWLFDSGKKNGFKALIYMHRYQPDTIARIRTDYVHEQQSRYRTAMADLEKRIDNSATGERVKLNRELNKLQAQSEEIRVYEEKIHHLADQMISIDLDDGVKHNYAIFKDVLAKIK